MDTQTDDNSPDMLEMLFQEFNGSNVYGLEYILDEFYDSEKAGKYINNNSSNTDWFGFLDLCI